MHRLDGISETSWSRRHWAGGPVATAAAQANNRRIVGEWGGPCTIFANMPVAVNAHNRCVAHVARSIIGQGGGARHSEGGRSDAADPHKKGAPEETRSAKRIWTARGVIDPELARRWLPGVPCPWF